MRKTINDLFVDMRIISKIKVKLPFLFYLAELESSRAGKVGMEIGSLRERILVALLLYKYGEENVKTDLAITKAEVDVIVFGEPISIKTITGRKINGFKLVWTVDAKKAEEFREKYYPSCDILLVHINWDGVGGLYFIPMEIQKEVFNTLGKIDYKKRWKLEL